MRILLVDDQELHRKVVGARLKRAGHTILEASDGTEALEILEKGKVEAVIADVLMPKMDGYELCQNIRSSSRLSGLPLILYSAIYTSPEDEKTALAAGADLFFRKPVAEEDLLSGLEVLISRARGKPRAKRKLKKSHALKEYSVRLVEKLEEKNEELEESQARFQTLVKTVASAIFIYQSGKILYANSAAEELTGYEVAGLLRMSPLDIIYPEDRDLAARRLFMGQGIVETSSRMDIRVVASTGAVKWVDFSANHIEYGGGQAVIGTALDITKRKQAEQSLQESEERFRGLVDDSLGLICIHDLKGKLLDVNPAALERLGYQREEMIGENLKTFLAPGAAQPFDEYLETIKKERTASGLMRIVTKSGKERFWLYRNVLREKKWEMPYVLAHALDITEQQESQERLEKEEEILREIFEAEPECVKITDAAGTILQMNQAGLYMVGAADISGVLGKSIYDLIKPAYHPAFQKLTNEVLSGKKGLLEFELVGLNGIERWMETHAVFFRGTELGEPAMLSVTRDITERKKAAAEIERTKSYLESILENSLDLIFTVRKDGSLGYINPQLERMFGYRKDEVVGKNFLDFIPDYKKEFMLGKWKEISEGIAGTYETEVLKADGSIAYCLVSHSSVRGYEEFLVILKDITERKKAEDKIKEQAALLDVDPAAISVIDEEGRVLFWNRSAERMYGWQREEIVGTKITERLPESLETTYGEARRTALEKGRWQGEWTHRQGEKTELIVESDWTLVKETEGKPKFIYVVDSDITERKRLEGQVLRAQRMESLGMIAGGIAHELNNVLGPIFLSLGMLQREVTDERIKKLLQMIEMSSKRGSEIVKQILGFVRGVEEKRVVVSPAMLVKEIEHLVMQTFPKTIQVRTRLSKDLWPVIGNATQLHQVLLNLCINARDAMPRGGVLTLDGENQILDEHYARLHPSVNAGAYIMLTITDTGMGIPPEVVGRIFEPFFTTKGKEKGTGLGLSVVAGIVQNHGGLVNVYSEAGKGASFRIYLPALHSSETEQAVEEKKNLPFGHGETILIVEDEPLVLEIAKETLESYGYRVLGASDGTEAMGLYAENKERVALVLCDMAMPFMDGPSTIRGLQKLNANVKVIVTSGFADAGKVLTEFGDTVKAFLPKPFPADKLVQSIHDTLNK